MFSILAQSSLVVHVNMNSSSIAQTLINLYLDCERHRSSDVSTSTDAIYGGIITHPVQSLIVSLPVGYGSVSQNAVAYAYFASLITFAVSRRNTLVTVSFGTNSPAVSGWIELY